MNLYILFLAIIEQWPTMNDGMQFVIGTMLFFFLAMGFTIAYNVTRAIARMTRRR